MKNRKVVTNTKDKDDFLAALRLRPILRTLFALSAATIIAHAQVHDLMDKEITRAIEEEFLSDDGVPYNDIDVTVNEGVVSLTGTVDNLLSKDRASMIAKSVKGVRALSNRLNVMPGLDLRPSTLKRNIVEALIADPVTESYEIDVTIDSKGGATLKGGVSSWREKEIASSVVAGVRGVTSVVNKLDISDAIATRLDSEIKQEIRRSLKWSTLIDDSLIDLSVEDGRVALSGAVGSLAEKRQALNHAWVKGVKDVDNDSLKVERWARDNDLRRDKYVFKSDKEIENAIYDAYIYDPRVNSFEILVDSQKGWVTLRGNVDSLRDRDAATTVARNTVGVLNVKSYIKIRPEETVSDHDAEEALGRKIESSPWIDSRDVSISVSNRVARLVGAVDSIFEKAQAEQLAQEVTGIKSIRNLLTVANTESVIVYDPYIWQKYPYPWYFYDNPRPVTAEVFGKTSDDSDTAKDIAYELYWSPFVDHEDVTVIVEDGIATLTGIVESPKEKDAAREEAIEGGAIAVNDKLVVDS